MPWVEAGPTDIYYIEQGSGQPLLCSRYVVIDGAPHNVYYEAAEAYNAAVDDFLAGGGPERGGPAGPPL